jgi:hypothetical protein
MGTPRRCLRRFAGKLMLVATLAFVAQSAMIIVSNAAACAGVLPQPALTLSGPVHVHDNLAGHVHSHGGDNKAGHVHGHVHEGGAPDDDDDHDKVLVWTIGCPAAVMAAVATVGVSLDLLGAVAGTLHYDRNGVDPDALIRPPSTPGIVMLESPIVWAANSASPAALRKKVAYSISAQLHHAMNVSGDRHGRCLHAQGLRSLAARALRTMRRSNRHHL